MARYSDEFIRQVIDAVDFVSLVSEYVKLDKKGRSYVGCCPFHNEKTGSFYIDADQKVYNCFGCHAKGNLFRFIMDMENVSFPKAVEICAEKAHLAIPEEQMSAEEEARFKERKRIYDVNKAAANYYYSALRGKYGTEGMKYLKEKRKLSDDILKSFAIGYSPKNGNLLINTLLQQGFKESDMEKAGIIVKSDKTGKYYDKFFGRIVFTIQDVNDNVIGFSGRILEGDGAKYMNTAEIGVFKKRFNLFALNKAKKSRRGFIILAEGNIDVVSLHAAGFDNAVASLGTALTPEQCKLLKKYTHDVVLLYDSDNAGIDATFKAIPLLRNEGINIRVLNVTDAKDPDEFINKFGAEEFEKILTTAKGYVEYELDVFLKKYDIKDSYQKKRLIDSAFERIKEIKDDVDKELYISTLSDIVRIDEDTLKRKINGEIVEGHSEQKEKIETASEDEQRSRESIRKELGQKQLISILLNDDRILFNKLRPLLNVGEMETDFLNALLKDIYDVKDKEGKIEIAVFLSYYEEREVQDQIMELYTIMKKYETEKRAKLGDTIIRELLLLQLDEIILQKGEEFKYSVSEEDQKKIALELTTLTQEKQKLKNKTFLED